MITLTAEQMLAVVNLPTEQGSAISRVIRRANNDGVGVDEAARRCSEDVVSDAMRTVRMIDSITERYIDSLGKKPEVGKAGA